MKYINQLDYPDLLYITQTGMEEPSRTRGLTTTIAGSGCGLCASIMVAHRLLGDCGFEIEDAMALSYESKANQGPGTSSAIYWPAFAEKFGFVYQTAKSSQELRRCLQSGGAAVVLVSGDHDGYHGVFSDRFKHYIAVVAEEADGRLMVLDSTYEDGCYEKGDRSGKVEVRERGV